MFRLGQTVFAITSSSHFIATIIVSVCASVNFCVQQRVLNKIKNKQTVRHFTLKFTLVRMIYNENENELNKETIY